MSYPESILNIRLVDDEISFSLSTGGVDYPGTALEVYVGENELFEFIVDEKGEMQVILYANNSMQRLSFALLEKLMQHAKTEVHFIPDDDVHDT